MSRKSAGIAVSPHHLASESARDVLREGGNAIEAMIAAAATIAVVYPHMNSLGGDSFWLIAEPGQAPRAIDACGAAGALASRHWYFDQDMYERIPNRGPLAALTVAGTVSGWQLALEAAAKAGGTLPLSRLLRDAEHHARHGVPVTTNLARSLAAKIGEVGEQPYFQLNYMPDGELPQAGTLLYQPRLADTLAQLVRNGLADFYTGELARRMASALERAGSPLRLADFGAHRAQWRTPLELTHRLGQFYNMPPPSQGLLSLIILGLLERLDIGRHDPMSADFIHLAVEATRQAFIIRDRYLTDPARMRVDPQSLLSSDCLDTLASHVDPDRAGGHFTSLPGDTVWLGAIDGAGRAVSFIQSIYHEFGSGVVAGDTGVLWQNRGVSFSLQAGALNALEPFRKPFHTLNPPLARLKDGRTVVYGSMGGDGQPQFQAAVLCRYLYAGNDLQQAVSAPRWLLGRTWGSVSETLKLEGRFPQSLFDELAARGHVLEALGNFDDSAGHAGIAVRHRDGRLEGAADPRSDGSAEVA
ncbi:gamma-glutamyltransferase family protein [Methyloversatilis thermotolerans]|uniref:gamma-glutamyltransferase family protein n=1 Tax=Methyloversatilis thermotolerans TaxID=1346290 RepID=UPI0003621A37|nr:gamma-glutamyltransferase family protein [Methyloversatilis thermotolerans]